MAQYGYQLTVSFLRAKNLPAGDLNGCSDPYLQAAFLMPNGPPLKYKSSVVWHTLNPEWNEFCVLTNCPPGIQMQLCVWDKDTVGAHDLLGRAQCVFHPQPLHHKQQQQQQQQQQKQQPYGPYQQQLPQHDEQGVCELELQLERPNNPRKSAGVLQLQVVYSACSSPGPPRMLGPVRFRQHMSPLAGILAGVWNDDNSIQFSTYKVHLVNVHELFDGHSQPWNTQHAKAAAIFRNPLLLSSVRAQHSSLYATSLTPPGSVRSGLLSSAQDFFSLINNGVRGGQRRYFTYALLDQAGSFNFCETGTALLADVMSKHAMHSGGALAVAYAGEFCVVPSPDAPGGHRLVLDNNSGTYAPKSEDLWRMAALFQQNFEGMEVQTVPVGDARLKFYHSQCPSRG